jgi:hypothetical protein
MVKKAKRAMTSMADTSTQALVAEFLHGFQDVLQDLGGIQKNSASAAPPFGSDTNPHVDSAATQQTSELLLEAEQHIETNQEARHQEDGLDTEDHTSLILGSVDEENNLTNDEFSEHPSLDVEEICNSDAPPTVMCDTVTPATDLFIPQPGEDEGEQLEDHTEMEQTILMVEPKCEENDCSDFMFSLSSPSMMLEEQGDSAKLAGELDASNHVGTEPCTGQQSLDVREDEDHENPGTAECDVLMAEHTEENQSTFTDASNDPIQIDQ